MGNKFFNPSRLVLVSFGALMMAGCGHHGETATVTLSTGLEAHSSSSTPFNMMARFTSHALPASKTQTCIQTQIFAGTGPHTSKGGTTSISTYPIQITTPIDPDVDDDFTNGALGWLLASTLSTVKLPVQVGAQVDIGIVGALSAPTTAAADGSCPTLNPMTQYPFPSYSLIGHVVANVTSDTVIPLNLWINNANPTTAIPLPPATSPCSVGDKDNLSQICPHLNYSMTHCMGNSCSTAYYAKFEYLYGANGGQHVTQFIPLSATSASYVPDVSPMDVTLYQSDIHGVVTPYDSIHIDDNGGSDLRNGTAFKSMSSHLIDPNTLLVMASDSGAAPSQSYGGGDTNTTAGTASTVAATPTPVGVNIKLTATTTATVSVNQCQSFAVTYVNSSLQSVGQPGTSSDTVHLSSTLEGSFYLATGCTGTAITQFPISSGVTSTTVYFKAVASGTEAVSASSDSFGNTSQLNAISVQPPTATTLSVSPSSLTTGSACTLVTVTLLDSIGVPMIPSAPVNLALAHTGSALTYSSSDCNIIHTITSTQMVTVSSVNFYVSDSVSESATITVTGSGQLSATINFHP